jgi:uncharacterized protein DUF6152
MKRILSLFVLFIFAVPLFAHHGTEISYDRSKAKTLKGTVTDFRYANPHPIVFFDVTEADGKVVPWVGEIAPTPFTLQQNGWGKSRTLEAFKKGTKIIITVGPSRVGTPAGVVMKITDEKGQPLLSALGGDEGGGRGRGGRGGGEE